MKLFLLITCLFIAYSSFAQTPKEIESNLLRTFKKIDYNSEDNFEANDLFAKKLKLYTEKYPVTINQKFSLLEAEHLDINSSADGLVKIYSWDTLMGGTMHIYNDLLQYKVHGKTFSASFRDTSNESDNGNGYGNIYILKAKRRIYYLAIFSAVYDTHNWGVGIRAFSIENGRLNKDVKIIKDEDGLSNSIGWYFNENENSIDDQSDVNFHYDEKASKIYLPTISGNGEKYNDYIIYKFTGQYFEKVKN